MRTPTVPAPGPGAGTAVAWQNSGMVIRSTLRSICQAGSARRRPASVAGPLTVVALTAAACSSGSSAPTTTASTSPTSTNTAGPPPIRHVFVIVLENEGYASTFGDPAADPYRATTLPSEGAKLVDCFGIGHRSNGNYIALISGQAPNPLDQADCQVSADLPPGTTVGAGGQIDGSGCVFPASVPTVADQLDAAPLTWKAYTGNIPSRESAVCGHPAVGSVDQTQRAVPGGSCATRHDPFVHFHAIIDDTALCGARVAPLGSTSGAQPSSAPAVTGGLAADLGPASTTSNLSFISPNLCTGGHDAPCVGGAGAAAANIDAFLSTWVPRGTHSPAFTKDGLLIVTFDEADVAQLAVRRVPPGERTSRRDGTADRPTGDRPALPQVEGPGQLDRLEHAPVMRGEQQGPGEAPQRRLQLLDRREVEMVGGLVEDQEVDPQRLKHRQFGPGALPRGEGPGRTGDLLCLESELGQ